MTKLEQDLSNIKQRNDELKQLSANLSTKDTREFQKLLKEKDKLEREALVQRMQARDQEAKQPAAVEKAFSLDDLKSVVPELREKSRQAYLKHRE